MFSITHNIIMIIVGIIMILFCGILMIVGFSIELCLTFFNIW